MRTADGRDERLIGARELALMKPTAVLVNCSRGKILDERALYEALAARRIRAAGLDVFEHDPVAGDNPLLTLDNVLATPHVGGIAADQVSGLVENLELFVAGQPSRRLANPQILDRGTARAAARGAVTRRRHPRRRSRISPLSSRTLLGRASAP